MQTLLSDYIGKQVIKSNGEYTGYVTGVELSKKLDTVRALICVDLEEDEFIIPYTAIKAFGNGGIIVKSLGGKLAKERILAPVGMRVLTTYGDFKGYVSDFETLNSKVLSIILSNGEKHPLYKIKGLGECVILDLNAQPSLYNSTENKTRTTTKTNKQSLNNATYDSENVTETKNDTNKLIEKKVTAGSNLLTGKKVPRNIFDARGNLIIKKDSIITSETLKNAVYHNKLFELTITVLNA